ncbi:amino acid permease-domain-containing protein [Annulohypoxylon bovei var. microspora]|nr:amino acid permease-domain-containing protein [Annulohypoxylon bovei var. microspora]
MDPGSRSDPRLLGVTQANVLPGLDNVEKDEHIYNEVSSVRANTRAARMAHRKLRPIHIFMITINTTLGTGLYWRGGQILELGGSLAVILSFLLMGILAWVVMQCVTELLCIWPVPGALAVFVREFVDNELGIAVGIAYWFTYSVAFAYLIASTAAETHYWTRNPEVDGVVLYLIVPLLLLVINSFGVQLYGWFEVVTGIAKLCCLLIIIISMIVFANNNFNHVSKVPDNWGNTTYFDKNAARNWTTSLFMCLSIATFAYVGIETPAAIALEARPTKVKSTEAESQRPLNYVGNIGETVRFSAKWISVFACAAYTLSGILLSLNVDAADPNLSRVGWVGQCTAKVISAFVLAAISYGVPNVASAFNGFLVLTALSCANTNLFIASRMLFGLTNQIDGGLDEHWYLNVLAWLGRTNSYRVPIRAMAVSALAFIWVPFLQLSIPSTNNEQIDCQTKSSTPGINSFIDILADMGSVGVLIVWACECWAFIRYYNCINRHKAELLEHKVPRVRRFDEGDDNDYPYISHGQPFTAYFGLTACLFILLVINGSSLWIGFDVQPFLSSYLIVIMFILLWVLLKIFRGARWSLVNLSDPDTVISIINNLHQFSFAGFQNESTSETDSSMWPLSLLTRPHRGAR